ncbi:hypothetical protein [Shewanella sp. GD03713]|uniref:hypothetical protein n=1 Tax=Shewanella sp. GD03713 TaxID=2975372 RepID=UPI002447A5C4|nr:hypothetical protein [Shewanella sp. GD03713]MDH1472521.1 hypothetical protein [Shewanella sp. GD03713]
MIEFSLTGDYWVATHKGITIELSSKCITLINVNHSTEAVIRFPKKIQDVADLSFFPSKSTARCAIILPVELGQLELADIGMSLVLRQFDTAGAQVQTVTAHI